MIEGVIFDVDGTLCSLKVDATRLRLTMIEELRKMRFDTSSLNSTSNTQLILDTAMAQINEGRVNRDAIMVRARLYSVLDKLEMEWNAESAPIDGTAEALTKLNNSEVKLAVLTNSGRASAEFLLRKFDLLKYFDFVLSRDDVTAMKPRPDGILRALELFALPKKSVIYVGDSGIDVRAAKAAGVKMVGVTSGYYTEERLREEGSDYIISSLSGLLQLLSRSLHG